MIEASKLVNATTNESKRATIIREVKSEL